MGHAALHKAIRGRLLDVRDFPSIQAAIDSGMGCVCIPEGNWSGDVVCKSNTDICLMRGAVLTGNVTLAGWMTLSGGKVVGNITAASPCVGATVRDVRLTGSLVLETSGSYINNNTFENIWVYGGGIVLNGHGTGEVSGNVFRIFHQATETTPHVLEVYGSAQYNDFNVCSIDWGNVVNLIAVILDNQTFYNRLYISGNVSAEHMQNGGTGNAVTVARLQA